MLTSVAGHAQETGAPNSKIASLVTKYKLLCFFFPLPE
jgi:hypothetical protein